MNDDRDEDVPGEDVQLDQLQPSDSLVNRGVADVLDEGLTAPDHWSPAQGFGNTAAEMRQGETLEQRVAQEEPEVSAADDTPWSSHHESREVGSKRAGRLVDARGGYPGEDTEATAVGHDVGIDGGAASAEEAAMHIIDEHEIDEETDE